MKPAPFNYAKPSSVDEAIALLGGDATLLAGGQSLVATLNMRLSAPDLLVDINGIGELSGISVDGGTVRIGALTRHRELERSEVIAAQAPLIAEAVPLIAHPAIRNRGTIGGSIAFADPAAELPACLLALDGAVEIAGSGGRRKVSAGEFFRGLYDTALEEGELITAIEVPVAAGNQRFAVEEVARRHGDYGMAGVMASVTVNGAAVEAARLVYLAAGGTPMLAEGAGAALAGNPIDEASIGAAQSALQDDLDPFDDMNSTAATKLHLARVMTERALKRIAGA